MKKSFTLFLTAFFFLTLAFGQADDEQRDVNSFFNNAGNLNSLAKGKAFDIRNKSTEKIDGTIYLHPDWVQSSLLTRDNKTAQVKIRYRVYDDEMLMLHDKEILSLNPFVISEVVAAGKKFVALPLVNERNDLISGFLEAHVRGELSLYTRYHCEIKPPDFNVALNVGRQNSLAVIKETTYVQTKADQPATRIIPKSKNVLPLFGQKQEAMKRFAKKEGMGFKKTADLIRLFEKYNELVSGK